MISSQSVSIRNRSHARQVNSGKTTISYGVPLFDGLVREESPHPAARNLLTKKLETLRYHTVKTRSLYLAGCDGHQDRRTDGRNHDS